MPQLQLRFSPTSPFVRKLRLVAHYKNLTDQLSLEATDTKTSLELRQDNPLGKIPVLLLPDGSSLYDSPVIAEYFDSIGQGVTLFPAPPQRWDALRLQALGDGMMDAAVLRVMERRKLEHYRDPSWNSHQQAAVARALAWLEKHRDHLAGITIGTITIAVALGYLDFRFAMEPWRDAHPKLADWHEKNWACLDIYRDTAPPDNL